jgi:transforming growth factor-beta-induced protein
MKKLFKKTGKILSMTLLATSVIWLGSCKEDEVVPTQTIWELVEANSDLTKLENELLAVGFDVLLSSDAAEYTLFAPSDQALTDLLSTLGLEDFSPVRAEIAQSVLAYHVHISKLLAKNVTSGSTISTYQGESITVEDGPLLTSGATSDASIVTADIQATNGVIHIIDKALVPPSIGALIVELLGTVGQPIFLGSSFSTLANAIVKADAFAVTAQVPTIRSILTIDPLVGKITVFAPVNAVFTAGSITVDTFTGEEWYGLILNHIVPGIQGAGGTAFSAPSQLTTYADRILTILATDAPTNPGAGITSGVVIDSNGDTTPEAQIALEDAGFAGNGTVHALAGVLNPN